MSGILIVDCFDSFTYNIYHYLEGLTDKKIDVLRYDKFIPEETAGYSHVVLSPGPGLPRDYPKIMHYLKIKPINQLLLGICLGHQCLGQFFGAGLVKLDTALHGVHSKINIIEKTEILNGLTGQNAVGHYHSWALSYLNFPKNELKITAQTSENIILSIEHRNLPLYGIQFHPESIMTDQGKLLLQNWLLLTK